MTPEEALRAMERVVDRAEGEHKKQLKAWIKTLKSGRLKNINAGAANLLLWLLTQDVTALELMATPGTACNRWYTAKLEGNHPRAEENQDECYHEIREADAPYGALRFLDRCNPPPGSTSEPGQPAPTP
jgi:hypothetical protein